MKKDKILLLSSSLIASFLSLAACAGTTEVSEGLTSDHDPFDYEGNFEPPELLVDGIKDQEYTDEGSDVLYVDKGSTHELAATFYRGEKALFAFFEVKDTNLMSYGDNAGDDVTKGDSVEFYLDTKNDGGTRPQTDDFQFNFGVNNKTRIMQGSGYEWGNRSGLVQYENVLNGTLNDTSDTDVGRSLEVMVSYKELGITKDSTLGVALGRVDKFGSGATVEVDYKWYGMTFDGLFIEPQTIDNYVSFVGRKFYLRSEVPLIKNINGVIKDTGGNALVDVKISSSDTYVTTDSDGKFSFGNFAFASSNQFTIEKEGYVDRVINISKDEASSFTNDVELGDLYLALEGETISTTFVGTVKNVKYGALAGATIELGTYKTTSDESGNFSLIAEYSAGESLKISKDGYIESTYSIDLKNVAPKDQTSVGELGIDLEYGTYTLGGLTTPSVELGVTRSLDSLIFKFSSKTEFSGEDGIEFYIDTKSSGYSQDDSDYLFFFNYESGILEAKKYGSTTNMSAKALSSKQYMEGDDYVILASIKYASIGVSAGEVVGFAAEVNYGEAKDALTFAGSTVDPTMPRGYVRIGVINELYAATNNIGGDVDPFTYVDLDQFGTKFGGYEALLTRAVEDSLFVKFVKVSGDWTSDEKVEFYIDTNADPTSQRNTKTYRIDLWGNATMSLFGNYTGQSDAMNDLTSSASTVSTSVSGDALTIQIPYALLGIKNNTTIGVSFGLWNNAASDWDGRGYEKNGYSGYIDPADPTKYVRIDGGGEVTTDTLTYTDLGTVGGKVKGEIEMSNLAMYLSRQEDEYMTLKVINETRKFEESRNGKENFEFYIDTGDKSRTGDAQTNPNDNYRDEKVFKIKLSCDGTSVAVSNYPGGSETAIASDKLANFVVTKIDDYTASVKIDYASLGITSESTIGFSCGVWNEEMSDRAPYTYLKERRVENAGQYLRIDKDGNILSD